MTQVAEAPPTAPLGDKAQRKRTVFKYVRDRGSSGATVADLRYLTTLHHGQVSSALSTLHKEGRICRLTERRGSCHVYVCPEYVLGRETQRQGRVPTPHAEPDEASDEDNTDILVRRISIILARYSTMAETRLHYDLTKMIEAYK